MTKQEWGGRNDTERESKDRTIYPNRPPDVKRSKKFKRLSEKGLIRLREIKRRRRSRDGIGRGGANVLLDPAEGFRQQIAGGIDGRKLFKQRQNPSRGMNPIGVNALRRDERGAGGCPVIGVLVRRERHL
jgi:hypothetical protein